MQSSRSQAIAVIHLTLRLGKTGALHTLFLRCWRPFHDVNTDRLPPCATMTNETAGHLFDA